MARTIGVDGRARFPVGSMQEIGKPFTRPTIEAQWTGRPRRNDARLRSSAVLEDSLPADDMLSANSPEAAVAMPVSDALREH